MFLMDKPILIICGNDCTGKTTLSNNAVLKSMFIVVERSSNDNKFNYLAKQVDNLTMIHTFDNNYKNANLLNTLVNNNNNNIIHNIYRIILTCPINKIQERLKNREYTDVWESEKALKYYDARFKAISADFGIPLVNTDDTIDNTVKKILHAIDKYSTYQQISNLKLTRDKVNSFDIHNIISKYLWQQDKNAISSNIHKIMELIENKYLVCKYFPNLKFDTKLILDMYAKMLTEDITKNNIIDNKPNTNTKQILVETIFGTKLISIPKDTILLKNVIEGESKKVFKIISTDLNNDLDNLCIIMLKSTIYSHSRQSTAIIENLAEIRAQGTQIFLEMLHRNGVNHCYKSINESGIIIADFVNVIPLEIVYKKYCTGTDKHSYYNLENDSKFVDEKGIYKNGDYIRFDWRNPNHIIDDGSSKLFKKNPAENLMYYVIEEKYGKEEFFNKYLKSSFVKPLGDKQISEDVVKINYDTNKMKELIYKSILSLQYYFDKLGLEIQDACFMCDDSCTILWSEINQDCMRIKMSENKVDYDKDIWRAGGSSSASMILSKWSELNLMLSSYLISMPFHLTELMNYETKNVSHDKLVSTLHKKNIFNLNKYAHKKNIIVTLDLYNGEPVLVNQGKVYVSHSGGNIETALNKINLLPDILVVDLNAAIPKLNTDTDNYEYTNLTNRDIIKEIAKNYFIYAGGGIKNIDDVTELLNSSVRRVVIGSNLEADFINKIPKNRLIIDIAVDENNIVLIKGRTSCTNINVIEYIKLLLKLNISAISLTFHSYEGLLIGLPREQIRNVVMSIPKSITKIIIAGGISHVNDLHFLWSLNERIIPQVGSAIWKNRISISDIYLAIFSDIFLIPTIIQSTNGITKGLIYLNHEALKLSCDTRLLYRYSRKLERVSLKGETSGNLQVIKKMDWDCDNDSLLITVEDNNNFCHYMKTSCFNNQTEIKTNLNSLSEHLKLNSNRYANKMQSNPELVLLKITEETKELMCSTKENLVHEAADLIVHTLMCLNGKNISLEDVQKELNARKWKLTNTKNILTKFNNDEKGVINIGITGTKYFSKTDNFIENILGVRITRPQNRSLKINYDIIDIKKYSKYFRGKTLSFITCRPKDMTMMLANGQLKMVITYNTVLKNQQHIYRTIEEVPDNTLRLCLIKRKEQIINFDNKIHVASEFIRDTTDYFANKSNQVSIHSISGQAESFLVNDTGYQLCDSIVKSGKTITDNNLEIFDVILDYGKVCIGLYDCPIGI